MPTSPHPSQPSERGTGKQRPAVRVVPDDAAIDVRAWARQVVAVALQIEGVRVTPTAIEEAS
jgi:hypothetical protein